MLSNNMSLVRTFIEESKRWRVSDCVCHQVLTAAKIPFKNHELSMISVFDGLCIYCGCDLVPDSPLPQGPLAVGVWAGHSACQLAHTVLCWLCSPGRENLHLGPGVSLHLVGSCGCGTRSPCGAAPHLGPQGLDGVEGWATGLLGPVHLHLQPEPCNLQPQRIYQN